LIEKTITINFLATDHAAAAAIKAMTRAVESAPGVDSKSVEGCRTRFQSVIPSEGRNLSAHEIKHLERFLVAFGSSE